MAPLTATGISPEDYVPRTKTRLEREQELQALMRSAEGREELEALATRYQTEGGRARPGRTSVITYILVHERQLGHVVD
jgi:hypothetical protein